MPAHAHGHHHHHHSDRPHVHLHEHAHGVAHPHPPQAASWSILRMTASMRLAAALAVSALLWAVMLLAMR